MYLFFLFSAHSPSFLILLNRKYKDVPTKRTTYLNRNLPILSIRSSMAQGTLIVSTKKQAISGLPKFYSMKTKGKSNLSIILLPPINSLAYKRPFNSKKKLFLVHFFLIQPHNNSRLFKRLITIHKSTFIKPIHSVLV